MGQKVNPISMRLQVHKNWSSKWFATKKEYVQWLSEDIAVRKAIEKRFETRAVINHIVIERSANLATISIHTSKAGVVIGRGGAGVTELKGELEKIVHMPVRINIEEVKRPELAAVPDHAFAHHDDAGDQHELDVRAEKPLLPGISGRLAPRRAAQRAPGPLEPPGRVPSAP